MEFSGYSSSSKHNAYYRFPGGESQADGSLWTSGDFKLELGDLFLYKMEHMSSSADQSDTAYFIRKEIYGVRLIDLTDLRFKLLGFQIMDLGNNSFYFGFLNSFKYDFANVSTYFNAAMDTAGKDIEMSGNSARITWSYNLLNNYARDFISDQFGPKLKIWTMPFDLVYETYNEEAGSAVAFQNRNRLTSEKRAISSYGYQTTLYYNKTYGFFIGYRDDKFIYPSAPKDTLELDGMYSGFSFTFSFN
jgi:hypothetical protein